MPRVKWSRNALLNLDRLHAFLTSKDNGAAQRALAAIWQAVGLLGKHPEIGRPVDEAPEELRELVIAFGQGAYVVLYHYHDNEVVILAVRHGREAGY